MMIENTIMLRSQLLRLMAATLIALGAGPAAANQDGIVLHDSVRLDADHLRVRLADVADLKGDVAIALGEQIVFQSRDLPTRPVTVNLSVIRQRLDDAGANLGLLALSGRECVIRWRSGAAPAETPAGEAKKTESAPVASAAAMPPIAPPFLGSSG